MGLLIKNGNDYTGGSAPIIDSLNSTDNASSLSANMGHTLATDIGVIESTTTAQNAHSVGTFFINNAGQLVKATQNIAIGNTIAIGSNVEASNVAAALAELNSNIQTAGYNRGTNITKYITDGSIRARIAGTNGFKPYEDICPWDYIDLTSPITASSSGGSSTQGTSRIRVAQRGRINPYQYSGNCLVMVPDTHFGMSYMNATNTTEGGYAGSFMATDILPDIDTQLSNSIIGPYLKTTKELLSNATSTSATNRYPGTTGAASGWAWVDKKTVLMSEIEVYGSIVWSSSGFDTGNACCQLEAFNNDKNAAMPYPIYFWLKDVVSSAYFALAYGIDGDADDGRASNVDYVRPRFVIA